MHRIIVTNEDNPNLSNKLKNKITDRNIEIIIDKNRDKTYLIGYDKEVKASFNLLNNDTFEKIFNLIDSMPMRKLDKQIRESNKSLKGGNKSLYSDDNPLYTIKDTGYKNKKMAGKTLDIINKRSIIYQKALVNAMYHRAKHHVHRTKDMKKAMKVFDKWLIKNKDEGIKYPYLPLKIIKKYKKLFKKVKSKGDKKYKESKEFYKMYKKYKSPFKLAFIPIDIKNPANYDYDSRREVFIESELRFYKGSHTLYDKKGNPTPTHLLFIMNAYSPDNKIYDK